MIAKLAAALAVCALALAPVARADTNDDTYMQTLDNAGVGHLHQRAQLITLGHLVCDNISDGMRPIDVAKSIYASADISQHDAGAVVGAAIAAYCPSTTTGSENDVQTCCRATGFAAARRWHCQVGEPGR
jgi:Protein of unknown function (DUF732)